MVRFDTATVLIFAANESHITAFGGCFWERFAIIPARAIFIKAPYGVGTRAGTFATIVVSTSVVWLARRVELRLFTF